MGHQKAEAGEIVRSLAKCILAAVMFAASAALPHAQVNADAVRFAVIGDGGTGDEAQHAISRQMTAFRTRFPFDLVLMLGDNLYRRASPQAYADAFERPYQALLDDDVMFVAVLGNHDSPDSISYPRWNMNGQRYFSFTRRHVRFFAIDTNVLDAKQLDWLDATLSAASEPWKIAYFHHPIYSNGKRHGSSVELRVRLEPLFVRHGVQAVFAGHDHMYERLKPQKGITYFVSGAAGQLRKGGAGRSETTAAAFDQEQSFMLIEVDNNTLRFQAISRSGQVIDAGEIARLHST
jgi:3',5'-cyclic AMP phosphodiesterase CpdA